MTADEARRMAFDAKGVSAEEVERWLGVARKRIEWAAQRGSRMVDRLFGSANGSPLREPVPSRAVQLAVFDRLRHDGFRVTEPAGNTIASEAGFGNDYVSW